MAEVLSRFPRKPLEEMTQDDLVREAELSREILRLHAEMEPWLRELSDLEREGGPV